LSHNIYDPAIGAEQIEELRPKLWAVGHALTREDKQQQWILSLTMRTEWIMEAVRTFSPHAIIQIVHV